MTYGRHNLRLVFRGGRARPLYLDPSRHRVLAETVIGFYEEIVGERAGEVEWEELRLIVGDDKLYNALRTIMERFYQAVKRCPGGVNPSHIRSRVFLYVNEAYGGYVEPGVRRRVLEELKERLGVDNVEESMWCDLWEERVIRRAKRPSPDEVIAAYNYETMDTVLVNSEELRITMRDAISPYTASILKTLGRLAKLHGLTYDASVTGSSGIRASVAGPRSVFGRATRYGYRLTFIGYRLLRSLAAWRRSWAMEADMRTSTGKLITVELASTARKPYLGSMRPSEPPRGYDSSVEEAIIRVLGSLGIRVEREAEPIVLPGGLLYIPDFVVKGPRGKAYIEVMGYWRREYAEKKLYKVAEITKAGARIILVADSRHRPLVEKIGVGIPVYYYTVRQGRPVLPYGSLLRVLREYTGL